MKKASAIFCFLGLGLIHWRGRSDGGGMGDAIQCECCGADRYGMGTFIHDEAEDPSGSAFDAWFFVLLGYATLGAMGFFIYMLIKLLLTRMS